jgi:hypothetical protein
MSFKYNALANGNPKNGAKKAAQTLGSQAVGALARIIQRRSVFWIVRSTKRIFKPLFSTRIVQTGF